MLTSIGLLSRIPTPPGLSTAVTGIGVIGSFLVTVASAAVIVGAILSRDVTVKVNVTGLAAWPALSVALNVIVFVLPTSSAVVVIVIRLDCSVSVFVNGVADTFPVISLLLYFVVKSLGSKLTCLSSLAVTVKVTCLPSTTSWLAGEIVNVGGWLSGASVGVTGLLLSEVTVPLLLVTTVSALSGFPGKGSLTVTIAVCPLVVPVPIILSPS